MGNLKKGSIVRVIFLLTPFLLLTLAVLFYSFNVSDELINIPDFINERIEILGVWTPVIFILLYIPTVLFFIPAWPLTMAGGMLFGIFLAPVYVMVGAGLGSLTAFSIARYLEGGRLSSFIKKRSERYYRYYRLIDKHGIASVIFLHFALLIPFAGINYLLGITKISFKSFIIGTFIGLIPGAIFYTYFGFAILKWNIIHFAVASLLLLLLLSLSLLLKWFIFR